MQKINFIVCLLVLLVIMLSSCTNSADKENTEEKYNGCINLTMPLTFYSEIPRDLKLVEEALNDITSEKIGVAVDLVALQDSTKRSDIQLMLNEGKHFDLINGWEYGSDFIPLDDLLNKYGRDILEVLTDWELEFGKNDGVQYRLKSRGDSADLGCICVRKDILDKYGISADEVKTWDDFDKLLTFISEREDMYMISPFRTSQNFFTRFATWDTLAASSFVLMDGGQSDKVELLFETDEYEASVKRFYMWRQNGWTPREMDMNDISSADLVAAGKLFSYCAPYKPGIKSQESKRCNMEMEIITFSEPFVVNGTGAGFQWGISSDCEEPEAAMKLLNLLYTDSDAMNLLNYGIEGTHYVLNEEGFACYPDGVDGESCGYNPNIGWQLPNQYLCYIWEGDSPTLWKDMEEFNSAATISNAYGFYFNQESVRGELNAIRKIESQYSSGLARGEYDPSVILPDMIEQMKEAGSDKIIAEIQRQFDEWKNTEKQGEEKT